MTKRAIILFLGTCFIFNLGHSKTFIELTIEAQSDYFALDLQAMERAELYCHQALGANAQTQLLRSWSTWHPFILHSSILCSRELDLEEIDPGIGKYLDHARWVLEMFSGQTSEKDDHQLVENTIKILSQIGAPALSVLWEDHVKHYDPATKITYFQCAIEEIIDNSENNSFEILEEVLNILIKPEKYPSIFSEQKSKLLRRGRWPIDILWRTVEDRLINSLLHIKRHGDVNFRHIDILVSVLDSFYWALTDRFLKGYLNIIDKKFIQDLTCEHLTALPAKVLAISAQTGLAEAIKRYECSN